MSTNFIFLHGGGQGSWVWQETIEAMKSQSVDRIGKIVALDVPGCGSKREIDTKALSVPDIVAKLLDDIDAAGIEEAVLVGHSQAGTLLPLLIKARPPLFRYTIYVSCLAPAGNQTALNWRTTMPNAESAPLNTQVHGTRDLYRLMFCNDMDPVTAESFLGKLGQDQWPASSYQMSDWDYSHLADHPSTYVICTRDAALLPEWQEIFAKRFNAKEIVRIEAGHQVMNTRPQVLGRSILAASSVIQRDAANQSWT